jgi:hypothetical protein
MMTRTAFRSVVSFTASSAGAVLVAFESLWKAKTPTPPAITRVGVGVFTITFPAVVNDEIGKAHTLDFRVASGSANGATPYHVQAVTAGNVITAYVFDMAGTLIDPAVPPNPADAPVFTIWVI